MISYNIFIIKIWYVCGILICTNALLEWDIDNVEGTPYTTYPEDTLYDIHRGCPLSALVQYVYIKHYVLYVVYICIVHVLI